MTSPTDYLRLALSPERLAILGHAATGPVDVAALAEALQLDERRLLREAGKLVEAGLLTGDLELDRQALRQLGSQLPSHEAAAAEVVEGPWDRDEVEILARFFQGTRLTQIPTSRSKRRVVLERIAQEFEPGVRYDERHVNGVLQVFWEDYAALRRYLVDEGFLTRAQGVYWRSGGRYQPVG